MPVIPAILLAVSAALPSPAKVLLTGGLVRVDSKTPPAPAAVLVVDGKIAFVGEEGEARRRGAGAREIALGGAAVEPGLADAHGHLYSLGRAKESLDLHGLSVAQIGAKVKERAATLPEGTWIEGRGWDQNLWPGAAFPEHAALDAAAPKHPVMLTRIDGHAAWGNAVALKAAGIDPQKPAPADPDGGRYLRDANGLPTGVAVDNAAEVLLNAVPAADAATLERRLLAAMRECAKVGLTSVGDASSYGPAEIAVLRRLAAEEKLPIRVYATVGVRPEDIAFLDKPPVAEGRLTVRAVKIYADGALGSRGAALLAQYSDEPGNSGLLVTPAEKMKELVTRCFRAGWQPWIHAIGDRGNRVALDAIAQALEAVKPKDARPRIEHVQVIALEDIPRFAKLGVVASVQPTHATSDMGWAEKRLGPQRIKGAYAYKSLLLAGARLAGGSDFPIESHDPRLGIYAAAARQDLSGNPPRGFRPMERLSAAEALAAFTEGVAYAEFAEARRGRIAEGFDADITVLDHDPADVPRAGIPTLGVKMTMVGGEIVFEQR